MNTRVRFFSITLLVVIVLMSLIPCALAATSKTIRNNGSATVVTGKTTALIFKPQITVKNTGSNPIDVTVYYNGFSIYTSIINLKKGQSSTITLNPKTTYTVAINGCGTCGYFYGTGTVTAKRNITSLY